jgi:hypothetical protein
MDIMRLGADVEVLGSESLRSEIADARDRAAGRYNSN